MCLVKITEYAGKGLCGKLKESNRNQLSAFTQAGLIFSSILYTHLKIDKFTRITYVKCARKMDLPPTFIVNFIVLSGNFYAGNERQFNQLYVRM